MNIRAAIYARISRDRVGAGLGVERQEQDCRDLAERLGWTVAVVHTDNDMSAYSGKPRPGYRALLDDVKAGRIGAVLAWHTDRLHRSPVELEDYISACTSDGREVPTHCVKAGALDLATPSGRLVARQLGAVARYEVEHMIERQKAAKAQAAAAGKWRGGPRPYGYGPDGIEVVEGEAKIIQEMTDRILSGESLRALAAELNHRGVPTSTGATWKGPSLKDVLIRARNAGLIEAEGREVAAAEWPAIVDVDVWRAVRALLTDPARLTQRDQTERWLGTGIYLCGICADGTTVRSSSNNAGYTAPVGAYRCRASGHLKRKAEPIDRLVEHIVVERLSRPDAVDLLVPDGDVSDTAAMHTRASALRARLDELGTLYGSGTIDASQLAAGTAEIRRQLDDVEGQLAHAVSASPLAGIVGSEDVAAAWAAFPIGRRKAIVRTFLTVTLHRGQKGQAAGGKRFDPRSVEIVWNTGTGADRF